MNHDRANREERLAGRWIVNLACSRCTSRGRSASREDSARAPCPRGLLAGAAVLLILSLGTLPGRAQVLHYEEVELGDDIAVQMTVRCRRPHLTSSLEPGRTRVLVTGMGNPTEFVMTRVRDATPDDLPLDLYFYVPNDLTMLDSYGDMMLAVAEVPAMMRTLGHREHHYYFYTYSSCAGNGSSVSAVHHRPYNRDYYLGRAGEVGGLREMVSRIPQEKDCTYAFNRRLFRGVNVHDALNALLALLEEEDTEAGTRRRPRILLAVAEGRNRKVGSGGEVDLERLEALFDQVILFQPDIAPVQFAIHQKRLGKIGGLNAAILRRYRMERKREKGCESWEGPARCYETIEQEVANVSAVLDDNPGIVAGAFGGRRFVSRVGLTSILSSITGREREAYVARIARDVDRAIPRPTGLDCLALALRERGLGDIVIVGGRAETALTCPGREGDGARRRPAGVVRSAAEALMELSPFAQARVIQGCVTDGRLSPSVEIRDRVDVTVLAGGENGVEAVCASASFMPDGGAGSLKNGKPAPEETTESPASLGGSTPLTGGSAGSTGEPDAPKRATGPGVPDWAVLVCGDEPAIAPPREGKRGGIPPVALVAGCVLGFLLGWLFTSRRRA